MDCQLSVILGPFAEEGISVQDVETCGVGYSMGVVEVDDEEMVGGEVWLRAPIVKVSYLFL